MGSWDLYGVEDNKRYPGLQAEFFERAAAPLTRRSAVYSFLALSTPTYPPPLSRTSIPQDMGAMSSAARISFRRLAPS